jgi:hypothetical protein
MPFLRHAQVTPPTVLRMAGAVFDGDRSGRLLPPNHFRRPALPEPDTTHTTVQSPAARYRANPTATNHAIAARAPVHRHH